MDRQASLSMLGYPPLVQIMKIARCAPADNHVKALCQATAEALRLGVNKRKGGRERKLWRLYRLLTYPDLLFQTGPSRRRWSNLRVLTLLIFNMCSPSNRYYESWHLNVEYKAL